MIFQVTMGCSHNACTFCGMYKGKNFRIKPLNQILLEIKAAGERFPETEKVFLADGDALILPFEQWLTILEALNQTFKSLKRVSSYATPKAILKKGLIELKALQKAGLAMLYMGLETGDDRLLKAICKGVNAKEMIEAGQMVKASGILLSATLISGLGGQNHMDGHAIESARVINVIQPDYLGLLTLMLEPGTPLFDDSEFMVLSPEEVLLETRLLLTHLALTHTVFRSNHASNYLNLSGTLPMDQERLISQIDHVIASADFKEECFRML